MRSFWIRNAITASAPVRASRSDRATVHPSFSMPAGISVEGPPTRTCTPSLLRQWMFVRAIPGIDDARTHRARHQQRRSGRGMADDEGISADGVQVADRVLQRLAL